MYKTQEQNSFRQEDFNKLLVGYHLTVDSGIKDKLVTYAEHRPLKTPEFRGEKENQTLQRRLPDLAI